MFDPTHTHTSNENILSSTEQSEYAKMRISMLSSNELFAEQRSSQLGDDFTRLEVQIAAITLTLASFLMGYFENNINKEMSPIFLIILKILFISTIILLITSLVMGLIHIKRKQMFWEQILHKRITTWGRWNKLQ